MPDDRKHDLSASRRAIDLYTAAEFARIGERLKALEEQAKSNEERIEGVYGEVFGGPHGQIGLSETLRSVIKQSVRRWGIAAAFLATLGGAAPWIIDHLVSLANKPLYAPMTMEEDWKINGGKRLRAFDEREQKWEYFYPEVKRKK